MVGLRLEGLDFTVDQIAAGILFYNADVDVLRDVACIRINADRASRALPPHSLRSCERAFSIGASCFYHLVNQMSSVIGFDGCEVCHAARMELLQFCEKSVV